MKINNFSVSKQHEWIDIVTDFCSTVDIVSDINFKPKEFNKSSVIKMIDLNEIAKEELVTVKGKVIAVTEIKKLL